MSTAIRVRDLQAGYGSREVLRSLSFELDAGRISVILGPGGSGKTTLLRALRRNGEPRDFWHRGQLSLPSVLPCVLRQKQQPGERSLNDLLTEPWCSPLCCDYLEECLDRHPRSFPWDSKLRFECPPLVRRLWTCAPEAAEALLPHLDVSLEQLPPSLARLAIFTAAVAPASPPFLLLDEPEVDMDPQVRDWMVLKLREVRGTKTVILVTHNLRLAREVADFAVLLVDGEIIEAAETPKFFEQPAHPRTRDFVRYGS